MCPEYGVLIHSDGLVEWIGKSSVKHLGYCTTRVSPQTLAWSLSWPVILTTRSEANGWWGLPRLEDPIQIHVCPRARHWALPG